MWRVVSIPHSPKVSASPTTKPIAAWGRRLFQAIASRASFRLRYPVFGRDGARGNCPPADSSYTDISFVLVGDEILWPA